MPKDEYLSGNVREKLLIAQHAAAKNPRYTGNVETLQAVQPLEIHQIKFRLGTTWVPVPVVEERPGESSGTQPTPRSGISASARTR